MKARLAAMTAVLLLALTGCTGAPVGAGDESVAPVVSKAEEPVETATPTPDVSAAPITASPAPSDDLPVATTPEAEFVAAAQDFLNSWGYWDFTDEQILGAGLYACESTDPAPQVIEGLDPAYSVEIVARARTILCP